MFKSRIINLLVSLFLVLPLSQVKSEIIEESGSLRGFFGGSNPTSAYDNWISHTVEGIARPGYNDYGPESVDPQNNDFGDYSILIEGGPGARCRHQWLDIFEALLDNQYEKVDSLLQDSSSSSSVKGASEIKIVTLAPCGS